MKIVCDYSAVTKAGNQLANQAAELQSQTTTFSSAVDSDLSGWTGSDAKETFQQQKDTQIQFSVATAAQAEAVGKYIVICAKAIKEADEQLAASISI